MEHRGDWGASTSTNADANWLLLLILGLAAAGAAPCPRLRPPASARHASPPPPLPFPCSSAAAPSLFQSVLHGLGDVRAQITGKCARQMRKSKCSRWLLARLARWCPPAGSSGTAGAGGACSRLVRPHGHHSRLVNRAHMGSCYVGQKYIWAEPVNLMPPAVHPKQSFLLPLAGSSVCLTNTGTESPPPARNPWEGGVPLLRR